MIEVVEALVETLERFGLIYFYFPVEGIVRKEEGIKRVEEGVRRKEEVDDGIGRREEKGGIREEGSRMREEDEKGKEEGRKKEEEKEEEGERWEEGRLKLEVGGFFKAVIEMIFDILVQSKDDGTIVRMTKLLVKYTLGEVKPINLGQEMLKSKKRNEKYFVNISCLGLNQIPSNYPPQESLSIQGVILILENISKVMKTKKKDEIKKSKGKPALFLLHLTSLLSIPPLTFPTCPTIPSSSTLVYPTISYPILNYPTHHTLYPLTFSILTLIRLYPTLL